MKILQSAIQMRSEHTQKERHIIREQLDTMSGGRRQRFSHNMEDGADRSEAGSQLRFSNIAMAGQPTRIDMNSDIDESELTSMDELKIELIVILVKKFTGTTLSFKNIDELRKELHDITSLLKGEERQENIQELAFGMSYDYYESHYEYEKTTFTAEGIVKTADGKELLISVDLSMTREFIEQRSIHMESGAKLKDPLVINFNGNSVELTETKFSFDLDMDGRNDQISFVGPDSGFLALDHNGDGKINDGSELFGPTTNDGFSELSAYDQDHNQFIDENDDIYHKLRIWTKDASGNDILLGLGERDVGAIYLGNIKTSFDLKDEQNTLQAQVKQSSIYLKDEGGAGTVQEVHLAI